MSEQAQAYFDELFIQNASAEWKEGILSDVGSIVAGGTPFKSNQEYYTDNGIAWITPKDLSVDKSVFISHGENDITELGLQKSSATMMPAGTVSYLAQESLLDILQLRQMIYAQIRDLSLLCQMIMLVLHTYIIC